MGTVSIVSKLETKVPKKKRGKFNGGEIEWMPRRQKAGRGRNGRVEVENRRKSRRKLGDSLPIRMKNKKDFLKKKMGFYLNRFLIYSAYFSFTSYFPFGRILH